MDSVRSMEPLRILRILIRRRKLREGEKKGSSLSSHTLSDYAFNFLPSMIIIILAMPRLAKRNFRLIFISIFLFFYHLTHLQVTKGWDLMMGFAIDCSIQCRVVISSHAESQINLIDLKLIAEYFFFFIFLLAGKHIRRH